MGFSAGAGLPGGDEAWGVLGGAGNGRAGARIAVSGGRVATDTSAFAGAGSSSRTRTALSLGSAYSPRHPLVRRRCVSARARISRSSLARPASERRHFRRLSQRRCMLWSAARLSNCACPIQWAFSPRGWRAASTIQRLAGRAAPYGPPRVIHAVPHRGDRCAGTRRSGLDATDAVEVARR